MGLAVKMIAGDKSPNCDRGEAQHGRGFVDVKKQAAIGLPVAVFLFYFGGHNLIAGLTRAC